MQTSIFIARLLGPLFVILGVALPLKPQMFRTIMQEFTGSPALLYLAGSFGLLGGLALVLTHNVWALDWRLIITLIGWVMILRALVTIFQPQWIVAFGSWILERPGMFFGAGAVDFIIGLVLAYCGYLA